MGGQSWLRITSDGCCSHPRRKRPSHRHGSIPRMQMPCRWACDCGFGCPGARWQPACRGMGAVAHAAARGKRRRSAGDENARPKTRIQATRPYRYILQLHTRRDAARHRGVLRLSRCRGREACQHGREHRLLRACPGYPGPCRPQHQPINSAHWHWHWHLPPSRSRLSSFLCSCAVLPAPRRHPPCDFHLPPMCLC
jgi:hypothetical protein